METRRENPPPTTIFISSGKYLSSRIWNPSRDYIITFQSFKMNISWTFCKTKLVKGMQLESTALRLYKIGQNFRSQKWNYFMNKEERRSCIRQNPTLPVFSMFQCSIVLYFSSELNWIHEFYPKRIRWNLFQCRPSSNKDGLYKV